MVVTMKPNIEVGQLVTLDSAQGPIQRVVVQDFGDVILVCREEELRASEREQRAPAAVGFPKGALRA